MTKSMQQINSLKKGLLDLSRRNPLINYPYKKSIKIDEEIGSIFKKIDNNNNLYFGEGKDNSLKISLEEEDFDKKIKNLYQKSRVFIEERGLSPIFLTVGLLKWEEKNGDENIINYSPILIVPLNLIRQSVHSKYKMQDIQDAVVNICLEKKLKQYGVQLPEIEQDSNLELYFEKLKNELLDKNINSEIILDKYLGFLNYQNLLIYEDLDESKWVQPISENIILKKLFGEGFFKGRLEEKEHNITTKKELCLILEADNSQKQSVIKVKSGKNLVIQGPPGTGKTQTIINIMSQAIYEGKTILVVSEKKAALEVINHKLKLIGLNELALPMYDINSSPKDLLESLKLPLKNDFKNFEKIHNNFTPLEQVESQLDNYKKELTKKYKNSGLNPGEIFSKFLELKKQVGNFIPLNDSFFKEINIEELEYRIKLVGTINNFINNNIDIDYNTINKINLVDFNPTSLDSIKEQCYNLKKIILESINLEYTVGDVLNIIDKNKILDIINYKKNDLLNLYNELLEYKDFLPEDLSVKDIIDDADYFMENSSFFHKLTWGYRSKRMNYNKIKKEDISSFLNKFKKIITKIHDILPLKLDDNIENTFLKIEINKNKINFNMDISKIEYNYSNYISLIENKFKLNNIMHCSHHQILDIVNIVLLKHEVLYSIIEYNQIKKNAINHELIFWLEYSIKNPNENLSVLYEFSYYNFLIKQLFESSFFSSFNYYMLEDLVKDYNKLENDYLIANRDRLKTSYSKSLTKALGSSSGLDEEIEYLNREFSKKGKHWSIRKTLYRTPRLVKKIKPIFLMTPQTVSSFLHPHKYSFDLVIFDESSQIKPVEALGSILRAKQVVIVGDSQQLPPTDFFEKTEEVEEFEDLENIMELFISKGIEQITLDWHYRSESQELIYISNKLFYENKLKVFPEADKIDKGIEFNYIENARFDKSAERINKIEAESLILGLKKTLILGQQSIAIVTMNSNQSLLIEDLIDKESKKDPEFKNYLENQKEPLIVKNLENIQGDERDIVFISLTYSLNDNNQLNYEFGPINRKGGARRLNVLFSRARKQMKIYSSIKYEDFKPSENEGVNTLKEFLEFAQYKIFKYYYETNYSNIIEDISSKLTIAGYSNNMMRYQDGIIHIEIDSYNKKIAIDLDSISYDQWKTVKEREFLKPLILEKRGWIIIHSYLINWFRRPDFELKRVISEIEKSIK